MFINARGISVERYSGDRKALWDGFIKTAKNATFLFQRDYMDYHSDRFTDHSLIVSRGAECLAVLPANLNREGVLVSHQGLTFGGLVLQPHATLTDTLEALQALLEFLHLNGVEKLILKRLPRFYTVLPDDEIDYALFLLESPLTRRDCALVVPQQGRLPFRKGRKSEISKAKRFNIRVVEETNFGPFWNHVLIPRLSARYGVKPVHSLEEITLLATRFPQNIRQFSAYCGEQIVAGTTIYETSTVAHAQYSGVTDEGQKMGALDFLYGWLITERFKDKRYFDFGISNEQDGRVLNHGLLSWKEAFGGRSCVHDFYEIPTQHFVKLTPTLPEATPRRESSATSVCS
jgi:hypothetical protein